MANRKPPFTMERSEWFARRRATIAYYSRFGFGDCLTLDHTHLNVSFALYMAHFMPLRFRTRVVSWRLFSGH